jgi:hypothetical protein
VKNVEADLNQNEPGMIESIEANNMEMAKENQEPSNPGEVDDETSLSVSGGEKEEEMATKQAIGSPTTTAESAGTSELKRVMLDKLQDKLATLDTNNASVRTNNSFKKFGKNISDIGKGKSDKSKDSNFSDDTQMLERYIVEGCIDKNGIRNRDTNLMDDDDENDLQQKNLKRRANMVSSSSRDRLGSNFKANLVFSLA